MIEFGAIDHFQRSKIVTSGSSHEQPHLSGPNRKLMHDWPDYGGCNSVHHGEDFRALVALEIAATNDRFRPLDVVGALLDVWDIYRDSS